MAENWYYAKSGERFGPFSEADMEQMITEGTVAASTNVWHEGMDAWKKAAETELAGRFPELPPVPDEGGSLTECVMCKKQFSA